MLPVILHQGISPEANRPNGASVVDDLDRLFGFSNNWGYERTVDSSSIDSEG